MLQYLKMIFYKVQYIEDDNELKSGYYLTKRVWAWLLASPIILFGLICYTIWLFTIDLYQFDAHWVGADKRKLTWVEYKYIFDQLSH